MSQYPFFRDEPWYDDELEDYRRAKNDDERRQMLLIFGCDEAHRMDAERLFAPPAPEVNDPIPIDPVVFELKNQTEQMRKYHSYQKTQHDADEAQRERDRMKDFKLSVISGSIGSMIGGLVVYALDHLPEIAGFFSGLIP